VVNLHCRYEKLSEIAVFIGRTLKIFKPMIICLGCVDYENQKLS
jgi:hypothetical protein